MLEKKAELRSQYSTMNRTRKKPKAVTKHTLRMSIALHVQKPITFPEGLPST
jgi:hypothetical protein